MGTYIQNSLCRKMFSRNGVRQLYILSVYYVGASEMTPHRGYRSAEIALAPEAAQGRFRHSQE
jgi:hypothetical protein